MHQAWNKPKLQHLAPHLLASIERFNHLSAVSEERQGKSDRETDRDIEREETETKTQREEARY